MSSPNCPPLEGRRAVALDARDILPEERSVRVSFSSESEDVRFQGIPEVLVHEHGCCDLTRLNSVLFNHDRDRVIGRASHITLDEKGRKARGTVIFDDDPASREVFGKVQSGSIRGCSVGFNVSTWKALGEGEEWVSPEGRRFTGPKYLAVRWTAHEFSLVSVPADGSVGVGRQIGQQPGGVPMDPNVTDTTPAAPDVLALERQRAAEILSLANGWSETRDLGPELVASGATVEAARAAVLARLAETRQPVGTARAVVIEDQRDKLRRDLSDSFLLKAGIIKDAKRESEISHPASLIDAARICLRHAGVSTVGMRPAEIAMRAVGSHTTSDFPYILANVADKSLQQGWKTAPATYEPLVRKRSVNDFKSVYSTKLGDAGLPELTPDGSPMPESSLAETGENYRIYTYAKRFSITRATLVNDDLDAFSRIPALMGAACRRKVNSIFWDLLTSASGVGPTMTEDGEALFSLGAARIASSGINYTTGAAAIGITTLSSSKALMRRQKGMVATGETAPILDIQPDFLIVPSALEMLALQYLATIAPATNADAQPEWVRRLKLIVEPSLDDATNGTTAWYLAASPSQIDGFEMAFLDGREEPTMIEVDGTNILGKEWGVYMDVGCKCVEFRGWMRNRGA